MKKIEGKKNESKRKGRKNVDGGRGRNWGEVVGGRKKRGRGEVCPARDRNNSGWKKRKRKNVNSKRNWKWDDRNK